MSSYNFIILRKKTDSKTGVFLRNLWNFQEQWWLLWKQVTYYYVGHKLAIFNAVLFTLLHLLLTRWWDMRLSMLWRNFWEKQANSRNVRLNRKAVLLMLCYIDKNWNHLIKEYLIIFKIWISRSCLPSQATKQTYFGNFTCSWTHPKPVITQSNWACIRLHHRSLHYSILVWSYIPL